MHASHHRNQLLFTSSVPTGEAMATPPEVLSYQLFKTGLMEKGDEMEANTKIRMFGALHTARRERGLESTVEVAIPDEGRVAKDVAGDLDLPMKKVEAVFINHKVYTLDHVIHPGDAVAFVPTGVPVHIAFSSSLTRKSEHHP